MKSIEKTKSKLLLFFAAAILILCTSFIFVGCGSDGKQKSSVPNEGQYAVDFTVCTVDGADLDGCTLAFESASYDLDKYKINNKALTVEAWVKPKATSSSAVLSRFLARGAKLFVVGNGTTTHVVPKFQIRRTIDVGGGVTSTADYVVTSTTPIALNSWSHIAGVLAQGSAGHTAAVHSSVTCGTAHTDDWHLDIYVGGAITDCAATFGGTTASGDADTTTEADAYAHNPADHAMGISFGGIVDEVRFWTADRADKIDSCKDQELAANSGDCGRVRSDLITYVRFNEGESYSVSDWAGLGSGTKEVADPDTDGEFLHWDTGWTTDTPDID